MVEKHIVLKNLEDKKSKIGIVGLGYVGLPLAISFSKKYQVIGFDINENRIAELKNAIDKTGEIRNTNLLKSESISFSNDPLQLSQCEVIIVAVPTPVDKGNKPDLKPLLFASKTVGEAILTSSHKVYISFESTVYPGCTEDDCVPVIEQYSNKKHGVGFSVGYSPERVNPGDAEHTFESITKVVSGSCTDSTALLTSLYASVVHAGIFTATSIKVAEAAKVIENTQRDINIALINELSLIFSKMGVDTHDVLKAAGTKWNFLKFIPGLVGGHCIGVDPYYLTYKAETLGYIPKVILSGRSVNDSMGKFVGLEAVKRTMQFRPKNSDKYNALILGFTFKENVSDVRNTKVIDIIKTLEEFNFHVETVDPIASSEDAQHEYGVRLNKEIARNNTEYDVIILAVTHNEFKNVIDKIVQDQISDNSRVVFIDVKSSLYPEQVRQISKNGVYWRL